MGLWISEAFGVRVSDLVGLGHTGLVAVQGQGGRSFSVRDDHGQVVAVPYKATLKTAAAPRCSSCRRSSWSCCEVAIEAFWTDSDTGQVDTDARLVPGLQEPPALASTPTALNEAGSEVLGVRDPQQGRVVVRRDQLRSPAAICGCTSWNMRRRVTRTGPWCSRRHSPTGWGRRRVSLSPGWESRRCPCLRLEGQARQAGLNLGRARLRSEGYRSHFGIAGALADRRSGRSHNPVVRSSPVQKGVGSRRTGVGAGAAAEGDAAGKQATWRRAVNGLERAQQAASSAAAAHGHRPGDPCPVCNRKLPAGWEPPASPDLDAARQAEEEARGAHEVARTRKETAAMRRSEVAGAFKAAASTLSAKADELAGAADARSLPTPPSVALDQVPSDVALAKASEVAGKAAAVTEPIDSWRAGLGELLEPLEEAAAARAKVEEADGAVKNARELAERAAAALGELVTERARVDQARVGADSAAGAATARIGVLTEEVPRRWSTLVDPGADEPVRAAQEACLADKEVVATAAGARDVAAGTLDRVDRRIRSLNKEKATTVREPLAALRIQLASVLQAVGTLTRVVHLPEPSQLPGAATPVQCLEVARAALDLAGEARHLANERAQDRERQRDDLAPPAKAEVERLLDLKAKADPDGTWIEAHPDPDDPLSPTTSAAVQRLVGAAGTAAATIKRQAEQAEEAVAEARNLDERLRALGSWRSDLAAAIEVLTKDNFPAWARDHRIAELVEVASQLLGAMTGGSYRFDSHLAICDEVAGAVQPATILSRGEKFEAALALALGVAEIAGRSGIRFDTLFLDEGFAGLDQPNLDRALGAIETEVEEGRRVVLITHIGAVADRIRDALFIEPDGMGGSRARWLDEEERFELGADLDVADARARR